MKKLFPLLTTLLIATHSFAGGTIGIPFPSLTTHEVEQDTANRFACATQQAGLTAAFGFTALALAMDTRNERGKFSMSRKEFALRAATISLAAASSLASAYLAYITVISE